MPNEPLLAGNRQGHQRRTRSDGERFHRARFGKGFAVVPDCVPKSLARSYLGYVRAPSPNFDVIKPRVDSESRVRSERCSDDRVLQRGVLTGVSDRVVPAANFDVGYQTPVGIANLNNDAWVAL